MLKGRIKDTFTPVIVEKLAEYGIKTEQHAMPGDDTDTITKMILKMANDGVDFILCTGGMSVDPDDKTPLAIKNTGADIVSYGAPVLAWSNVFAGLSENAEKRRFLL